jgi:hypothetical protein
MKNSRRRGGGWNSPGVQHQGRVGALGRRPQRRQVRAGEAADLGVGRQHPTDRAQLQRARQLLGRRSAVQVGQGGQEAAVPAAGHRGGEGVVVGLAPLPLHGRVGGRLDHVDPRAQQGEVDAPPGLEGAVHLKVAEVAGRAATLPSRPWYPQGDLVALGVGDRLQTGRQVLEGTVGHQVGVDVDARRHPRPSSQDSAPSRTRTRGVYAVARDRVNRPPPSSPPAPHGIMLGR